VPPLTLTVPGSLCVEPGDVAALPGELVASRGVPPPVPHPKPWRLSAYAGAAPTTAMATMQLAVSSLCPMITFRSGARPSRTYTLNTLLSGGQFGPHTIAAGCEFAGSAT